MAAAGGGPEALAQATYVSDGSDDSNITSSPVLRASSYEARFDTSNSPHPFLRRTLDAIKPAGSFASFNSLSSLNLGLVVPDVGTIAMPLQEPQARQIIEKARQAPYGRGEETVVDTSVRSTWELDAGQFELQGPAWETLLETVLASVKKSLGVASPIRAELYKMLLYEEGAMFKAHTDSPKIPGMFGTLVIVLPSIHQGGEVVLRHRGEKKVFPSSHVAQGFMSWYSDVQHEVLPVTMGYRWVLTYNMALVDPSAEPPFASRLGHEQESHLFSAVEEWIEGGSGSPVYTLDHNYTEARISLHALKGRDMAVVQALRDISSKLPVDIFLAVLEKQDTGSCDGGDYYGHYNRHVGNERDEDDDEDDETGGSDGDLHSLIDIIDTQYSFKKLVDLSGTHLAENFVLHEKDLLVRGAFAKGRVREIDYEEGFSGNEGGPSATHAYRVSGVVLVRRRSNHYFMLSTLGTEGLAYYGISGFDNLCSLITYYCGKCEDPSKDEAHILLLKKLCNRAWQPTSKGTSFDRKDLDGVVATLLLQTAVRMRDWGLFKKAVENTQNGFTDAFHEWIVGEMANGLPFADIKEPLLHAVLSLPRIGRALLAITSIAPPKPLLESGTNAKQEWALMALDGVLNTLGSKTLDKLDGGLLISYCMRCYDVEHIRTTVVPLLEKQTMHVPFCLGALSKISEESRRETDERKSWSSMYERLATSLVASLDIISLNAEASAVSSRPAKVARHYYNAYRPLPEPPKVKAPAIEGKWLAEFYNDLLSLLPSSDLATTLTQNISKAAEQIRPEEFVSLWIPFLQQLVPVLEKNSVPLSTPQYQEVFVALLDAFLRNYVRKEVTKEGRTLQRPTVSCHCGDCGRLNAFLADPTLRVGRFSIGKGRRQHLHNKLDGAGVDCQHVTERIGNPQTLVVTKTSSKHDTARREWLTRKTEAEKMLRAFPNDKLRTLLGAEYLRIFHMEDILWSAWKLNAPVVVVPDTFVPGPSVPGPSVPVRGMKRKAEKDIEVVDLTGLD